MSTKKELKDSYKQMRSVMGVFMYKCLPTQKVYLGFDQNVKAAMNGISFQLKTGRYPANKNLEEDWKKYGENEFETAVLETLEYDKDESKTDYTEDLRVLRTFWVEKFETAEFIKK